MALNHSLAWDVLEVIHAFPRLRETQSFLVEVAYAVSALNESEFGDVSKEDATYSDSSFAYENVVEFSKWRTLNYTENAAKHFASVLSKLHLANCFTCTLDISAGGSMASGVHAGGSLGGWEDDDYVGTVSANPGAGTNADVPEEPRFVSGVARLIGRRKAELEVQGQPEEDGTAIFILEPIHLIPCLIPNGSLCLMMACPG